MVVYKYYMYKVISRDLQEIRKKNVKLIVKEDNNKIIVKEDVIGEYLKFEWIWII